MAVVTVKSAAITNRDATPIVLNRSGLINGNMLRHVRAVIAITSGNSIASIYKFFEVPAGAIPVSMRVSSPDIGSTTTGDIGLYRTTADGGAVVSVALFGSAVDVASGALAKVEVLRESTTITVALSEQPLWQLLALSSDPMYNYDVCLTLTGTADGSGSVLLEMDFIV